MKNMLGLIIFFSLLGYGKVANVRNLFDKVSRHARSSQQSCTLPPERVIRVGCTHRCPRTYIDALNFVAKTLHYRVKVTTLQGGNVNFETLPKKIDAILSPGGNDIDPKYYIKHLSPQKKQATLLSFRKHGKTNTMGKKRDAFEYTLFRQHYFKDNAYRNMPVLGVCYGAQMLAAAKQIPLYVDIPTDLKIPARRKIHDAIYLNKKSHLFSYLKTQSFRGYKNHHQAIDLNFFSAHKRLFPHTKITATSNRGKIAEVIEFDNRPAVGVQFHPERSNEKTKKAVFSQFLINACRKIRHEGY